jgi:hypothetical protein
MALRVEIQVGTWPRVAFQRLARQGPFKELLPLEIDDPLLLNGAWIQRATGIWLQTTHCRRSRCLGFNGG